VCYYSIFKVLSFFYRVVSFRSTTRLSPLHNINISNSLSYIFCVVYSLPSPRRSSSTKAGFSSKEISRRKSGLVPCAQPISLQERSVICPILDFSLVFSFSSSCLACRPRCRPGENVGVRKLKTKSSRTYCLSMCYLYCSLLALRSFTRRRIILKRCLGIRISL